MKIKYIGLSPITNIYGNWNKDDIKEVPEEIAASWLYAGLPFCVIKDEKVFKPKKIFKRPVRRQELQDKMDRDNTVIINGD